MEHIDEARLSSLKVVQVSADTFALECNDKLYYIGTVLFSIVQHLKNGKHFVEIQELIAAEYKLVLSREKFDQVITDTLSKITDATGPQATDPQSYVYGQVVLFKEPLLAVLTRFLQFLLRRQVVISLLIISLLATGLLLLTLHRSHLLSTELSPAHGLAVIVGSYIFFALVGLFHELGHAAAATRFGITPKEVGFGFYLVIPVLYTDISKVWLLDKHKRILVNLAGIYFQLLINILLSVAYLISLQGDSTITYLIISFFLTNATLALYSLNPFFRNDGYWVCSDYFGIPNLSAAAQNYPRKCWNYLRSKGQIDFRNPGLSKTGELLLLAYTMGRISLMSWLSYLGYSSFYHSFRETVQRVYHEGEFANEPPLEYAIYLAKTMLFCILFLVLAYRTLKPLVLRAAARLGWETPTSAIEPVAVPS